MLWRQKPKQPVTLGNYSRAKPWHGTEKQPRSPSATIVLLSTGLTLATCTAAGPHQIFV